MCKILSFETATKNCSVVLSDGGEIIGMKELGGAYNHAEVLTVFAEEVLAESGCKALELDAIAVSKGPGSYTGLRIGVSAAKGLCYALNIPLLAVNTLDAMAVGAKAHLQEKGLLDEKDILVPMIDARRMEVYTSHYNANAEVLRETKAEIIEADYFSDVKAEGKIWIFGDGAEKCLEVLNSDAVNYLAEFDPSARWISQKAQEKYKAKEFEDVAYFEPFYLKDFIALKSKVKGLK